MKPELFYELCDRRADLLDLKYKKPYSTYHDAEINDLRDQIALLEAILEYIPDEDEERALDRRAEQDYCRTAGYPI